jgi:hypothetical protein
MTVEQTAAIPTYFMGIFGIPTIDISTTATAAAVAVAAAPSNAPTQERKQQDCLNKINGTPDGKLYNYFSYLSSIYGPDASILAAEQDAAGEAAQAGAQSFLKSAAKNWSQTALGSGSGFVSGVWELADEFAMIPLQMAATTGQLTVYSGCYGSSLF